MNDMRLLTLVVEASFLTGVLAVPSLHLDPSFDTFVSGPFVAKRAGGLPSCTSSVRNPAPVGTKCGSAGKINADKATQNLISSTGKVATISACADKCRLTASCGSFSYVSKKCTLYKQNLVQNKFVAAKTTTLWYSPSCFQCTCAGANQTKQKDGTCACSTGTVFSAGTNACARCPTDMIPNGDSTSCVCQGNQQPSADNTSCACATGSSAKDSSQPYQCTLDCPTGSIANGTSCVCQGNQYSLTSDGSGCQCPDGWSVKTGSPPYQCTMDCISGASWNSTSLSCACDQQGYTFSLDGQSCVPFNPVVTLPTCPDGSIYSGSSCQCFFGVLNNAGTACVDPCNRDGSGKISAPDGTCVCFPTYKVNANGVCACPDGTSVVNNLCTCPGGLSYSDSLGQCVCPANSQPGTCSCGSHTLLSSDGTSCSCVSPFVRSSDGYNCGCPSGLADCGNSCNDLSSDKGNCGSCFNICPLVPNPGSSGHSIQYNCISGQCVSPF